MVNKIRLASLASNIGIGGTARQIISIDEHLNKEIFEHFVISLSSEDSGRARFLKNPNVYYSSDPQKVAAYLEENKIDILFVHRHGRNEPIHDEIARLLNDKISVIELNVFSALDTGDFGRRCDVHIFVSCTNLLKYIKQNNLPFNFDSQKVVYGLVDSANFIRQYPTEQELQVFKAKYNLQNSFVVGRLARADLGKWDDQMVIFWKHLSQMNSKAKFMIYGVPEEKRKLLKSYGNPENLIILEQTYSDKELALFYSTIDAFVHMSPIGECSCGAIAEAMLFGKPIVVTSTPFPDHTYGKTHTRDNGQLEQIKNGENGYVVDSALAMAKAVQNLYEHPDLAAKMGELNKSEVINKYDAAVGIKTFEKIFLDGVVKKGAVLTEAAAGYADSLSYYPSKTQIENWFEEYGRRLKDFFANGSFSLIDILWKLFMTLKRKFRSLYLVIFKRI